MIISILWDRLRFWRHLLHPWAYMIGGVWSILSVLLTFRDNFLSSEMQKSWATLALIPKWSWRTWIIGVLIIILVSVMEASYRFYATEKKLNEDLNNQIAQLKKEFKSKLESDKSIPRVILKYGPNLLHHWQIFNAGGDAFNVTSDPISGTDRYAVVDCVPHLCSRNEITIQFKIVSKSGHFTDYYYPDLEPIFQSLISQELTIPLVPVLLRYNDASGNKFESLSEIDWMPGIVTPPKITHKYAR